MRESTMTLETLTDSQLQTLLLYGMDVHNAFIRDCRPTMMEIVHAHGQAAWVAVTALIMLGDVHDAVDAWVHAKAKCTEMPDVLPSKQLRSLVMDVINEFTATCPYLVTVVNNMSDDGDVNAIMGIRRGDTAQAAQQIVQHLNPNFCTSTVMQAVELPNVKAAITGKTREVAAVDKTKGKRKGRYIVRLTPAQLGMQVDEVHCAKYEEAWDYALMEEEEYAGRIDLVEVKADGTEVVHQTWQKS